MKKLMSVILDIVLVLAAVFVLTGAAVKEICAEAVTEAVIKPVSYTHLDVYKRQQPSLFGMKS